MVRLIIVGGNELTREYIHLISKQNDLQVVAIIDNEFAPSVKKLANNLQIKTLHTFDQDIYSQLDYVVYPQENGEFLNKLSEAEAIVESLEDTSTYIWNDLIAVHPQPESIYQQYVCNDFHTGLIIIDQQERIRYINDEALNIIDQQKLEIIGEKISDKIKGSLLPNILKTRTKELYQSFNCENGTKVIASRYPIINNQNHLTGAYVLFKRKSTVIEATKKFTNYNELHGILEALLATTQEIVSIVDENGLLIRGSDKYMQLVNSPKSLIGKKATEAMFAGNVIHEKVLKNRRPITLETLATAISTYSVKASPIIVKGKMKGSIAVFTDMTVLKRLKDNLNTTNNIIRKLEATYTFENIIYQDSEMNIVLEQAKFAANTNTTTVLLKGDKGTGKTLLANAIHNESDRKYNKFIHFKCSNKHNDFLRHLDDSSGGTLFIDGIEHLDDFMQDELLTILKESHRVSIIVSTNKELEELVRMKQFGKELFDRLNRITITIPALKHRKNDILPLTNYFVQHINYQYGTNIVSLSELALKKMMNYSWPGNVMQLENVLQHAAILLQDNETIIDVQHLPIILHEGKKPTEKTKQKWNDPLQKVMDDYERAYIKTVYEHSNYNKTKAAKSLGISVRSLYYKIDKYRLDSK